MKCVVLTACVMVAVASILNTAAADDKGDGEHAYDVISVEQTKKLKAIRDSYKRIAGLDKRYTDREHTNGLPYHIYVPKALEAGKKYPLVTFLHGYSDLTIDTHKGFPKGVWSLPLVQEKHPHILFVPRHRTLKDRWTNPKYRAMTIQALDDLVAELNGKEDTPNVDTNRIYLTGFSLGGIGTWNFIKNYPVYRTGDLCAMFLATRNRFLTAWRLVISLRPNRSNAAWRPTCARRAYPGRSAYLRMARERQVCRPPRHLLGSLRHRSRPRLGGQQHQRPGPTDR